MGFEYNLLHIFGIFLIISYFDGTNIFCNEDKVVKVIEECGNWDERSPAPWIVTILRKRNNDYERLCDGSIVTPNVIITAAQCFVALVGSEHYKSNEMYVAPGKNVQGDKLNEINYIQVKEYHITPDYKNGYDAKYAGNLAVVVLQEPFQITNAIQPVCFDRNNNIESQDLIQNNNKTEQYQYIEVSDTNMINLNRCFQGAQSLLSYFYIPKKICPFVRRDRAVCGSIGEGIIVNNKQQFIRGIIGFTPTVEGDGCDPNLHIGIFTNISKYHEFILQILDDHEIKIEGCPDLKTIEHGKFELLGQRQSYKPGTLVPNYSIIKFTCDTNYALRPTNSLITCLDNTFTNPIPQCKLTCTALVSSSVDVTCKVDGYIVECNEPLVEGAVARSKCKPFYTQSGYDVPISRCSGGTWSNPLIRCIPECGEVISNGVPNIVNGKSVKIGEFPWHIALYRLVGEKHEYQCGGSIINPLIIITAAHCFTDERASGYPAEEFYVGAGKYYSNYNSAEDVFAQKRQVKEYYIPPQYKGFDSNYAGDLAVVIVRIAFEMTNVVQPVCMDWDGTMENEQLKHNNIGSIVGWGYVDPNIPKASAEIKLLNPPFIDLNQCLNEVPSNFRRWVTPDKFCAGFLNGSSICKGDSGGGLVFKWNNNREKYFLRGLVSVGPVRKGICNDFQYGVYTKISFYNNFILNIIATNPVKN